MSVCQRLNVIPTTAIAAKMFNFETHNNQASYKKKSSWVYFINDVVKRVPFDQGVQFILSIFQEVNAFLKDTAYVMHFHSQYFIHVSLLHTFLTNQIHHSVAFIQGCCFCQQRILIYKHHDLEEIPVYSGIKGETFPCTN